MQQNPNFNSNFGLNSYKKLKQDSYHHDTQPYYLTNQSSNQPAENSPMNQTNESSPSKPKIRTADRYRDDDLLENSNGNTHTDHPTKKMSDQESQSGSQSQDESENSSQSESEDEHEKWLRKKKTIALKNNPTKVMFLPPPSFFKKRFGMDPTGPPTGFGPRAGPSGDKPRTNLRVKGQKSEKNKTKTSSRASTRKGSISVSKHSAGKPQNQARGSPAQAPQKPPKHSIQKKKSSDPENYSLKLKLKPTATQQSTHQSFDRLTSSRNGSKETDPYQNPNKHCSKIFQQKLKADLFQQNQQHYEEEDGDDFTT